MLDLLLDGVIQGAFGSRRKKSKNALRFLTGGRNSWMRNPQTLLTAAGLAWGVYETLQGNQGSQGSPGAQGAWGAGAPVPGAGARVPPLPNIPGAPAGLDEDALRIVRLAISAARADGVIGEHEHAAIVRQAKLAGAADLVEAELAQPRPLAEIVAGVTDRAECGTLYVLAYTILRADEQVSGAERIYLAQLANLLGLSPQDVQALEKNVGERITALGDQGQLGG